MLEDLAERFDDHLAIDVGWQQGDNQAFGAWLKQFAAPQIARPALIKALEAAGVQAAISKCGGGSDVVYWFDMGKIVMGLPNHGTDGWIIPASCLAEMPDVIIS